MTVKSARELKYQSSIERRTTSTFKVAQQLMATLREFKTKISTIYAVPNPSIISSFMTSSMICDLQLQPRPAHLLSQSILHVNNQTRYGAK